MHGQKFKNSILLLKVMNSNGLKYKNYFFRPKINFEKILCNDSSYVHIPNNNLH